MRALRFGIVVAMLALTACATALPPVARVTNISLLAGSYSGTMKETGVSPRPTRIVMFPDGSFEITTGGPDGFRTNGRAALDADGSLAYEYEKTKGRAMVYEGDGRRVIVFTRSDGRESTTVDKSLP